MIDCHLGHRVKLLARNSLRVVGGRLVTGAYNGYMAKHRFNIRTLLWLTATLAAFFAAWSVQRPSTVIAIRTLWDVIRDRGIVNVAVIIATPPVILGIRYERPLWGLAFGVGCAAFVIAVSPLVGV